MNISIKLKCKFFLTLLLVMKKELKTSIYIHHLLLNVYDK